MHDARSVRTRAWKYIEPKRGPPRFYDLVSDPGERTNLADRSDLRLRVLDPVPGLDNILFMSREHLGFLQSILSRLGGTATRPPRAIMETPNQPIGASLAILDLWKKFFAARPGHWSGWVLETYPYIGQVEFLNTERTRAIATVRIGYGGATVVLEKQDGAWIALRLTNIWVT